MKRLLFLVSVFLICLTLGPLLTHRVLGASDYGVHWNWYEPPSAMEAGKTYSLSLNMTNTGSFPWPSGGPNPVYIAYHWYTATGDLVEWDGQRSVLSSDVAPGANTTVSATVTALGSPGSLILQWDLVQEGVTWFSTAGCSTLNVPVGANYGVAWGSQDTPSTMRSRQTYGVSINVTNTGNFTWPSGGAFPVHLAYRWYTSAGDPLVWDGQKSVLSSDVAPGQGTTVSTTVIAPGSPSSYILKWDLVQEGVGWLGSTLGIADTYGGANEQAVEVGGAGGAQVWLWIAWTLVGVEGILILFFLWRRRRKGGNRRKEEPAGLDPWPGLARMARLDREAKPGEHWLAGPDSVAKLKARMARLDQDRSKVKASEQRPDKGKKGPPVDAAGKGDKE